MFLQINSTPYEAILVEQMGVEYIHSPIRIWSKGFKKVQKEFKSLPGKLISKLDPIMVFLEEHIETGQATW
jgi:hypothetical protein